MPYTVCQTKKWPFGAASGGFGSLLAKGVGGVYSRHFGGGTGNMKRARKAPHIPLADLRLNDLYEEPLDPSSTRLVNLKVPANLLSRVHDIARKLGVTKSAAIVALLNEGLAEAEKRRPPARR